MQLRAGNRCGNPNIFECPLLYIGVALIRTCANQVVVQWSGACSPQENSDMLWDRFWWLLILLPANSSRHTFPAAEDLATVKLFGLASEPYLSTPWLHCRFVGEENHLRPVARIFWRGVMLMSNVYVCICKTQGRKTRGIWGDAPPGNF